MELDTERYTYLIYTLRLLYEEGIKDLTLNAAFELIPLGDELLLHVLN